MIKNIFIPEHVGSYYIFAKRIIGLDITKTDIYASQVYVHGSRITLEKFIKQPLDYNGTPGERIIEGLKKVMAQVDAYDTVHTTIPSSVAIFKTLKLPFTSYEKIKMVIGYEIEPLLPFSISQATIDFIITKTDPIEKSAEVFVCAVQNQSIADHIALCEQAGIQMESISIDMIALYTIYQQFPDFNLATSGKNVVLLDFGPYETRLAYLHDSRLKLIRTLSKGFLDQAKAVSKELSLATGQALEHIMRFGLEKNNDHQIEESIKKNMGSFINELTFTLSSFSQQSHGKTGDAISKILLVGEGSSIKGLAPYITQATGISCEIIRTNDLLHNPRITARTNHGGIPSENLVSLGAAFNSLVGRAFTLLPAGRAASDNKLLARQIITALSLGLGIIALLFIASFMQIRSLSNEAYDSAQEVIEQLQASKIQIKTEAEEETDPESMLPEFVQRAQTAVNNDQKVVSEFSTANRESFLSYLYELSKLDKHALGLHLDHLIITPDKIIMSGQVSDRSQPALRKALKESNVFGSPTPTEELDKTNFTNVTLPIIRQAKRTSR